MATTASADKTSLKNEHLRNGDCLAMMAFPLVDVHRGRVCESTVIFRPRHVFPLLLPEPVHLDVCRGIVVLVFDVREFNWPRRLTRTKRHLKMNICAMASV